MANKYAVASGPWSSTATWSDTDGGAGGAAVPIDGSAVFISAGVNVLMDVDQSLFTGLQTVTVRGGATPGMLYWADGTSGFLKIQAGSHLVGTTDTNNGRVLANSDGVWGNTGALGYAYKAVIDLTTTAQFNCANLDVRLYCTEPTIKYVETYGTKRAPTIDPATDTFTFTSHGFLTNAPVRVKSTGVLPAPLDERSLYYVVSVATNTFKLALASSGTAIDITDTGSGTFEVYGGHLLLTTGDINVFQDVTGDPCWDVTNTHDGCCLVDYGNDIQRVNLSVITAGVLTFATNVDSAQYPKARIYLTSRNISIRSSVGVSAQGVIINSTNNVFLCEIRGASISYGAGLAVGTGNTFTLFTGLNYGFYGTSYDNYVELMIGMDDCHYAAHNSADTCAGATNAMNACYKNRTREIFACGIALNATVRGNEVTEKIEYCTNGIYNIIDERITCDIFNCGSALYRPALLYFSGEILGCGTPASITTSSRLYTKNVKMDMPLVVANRNSTSYPAGACFCENLNRVQGADIAYHAYGDVGRITFNGSTGGPNVDPLGGNGDGLYCTPLSNCARWFLFPVLTHRIWVPAGVHTLTYKAQSTFTADLLADELKMVCEYIGPNSEVVSVISTSVVSSRGADTDWTQEKTVSFTSSTDGWVDVIIELGKYEAGAYLYVWPVPVIT